MDHVMEVLGEHTVVPKIVNDWENVKDLFSEYPLVSLNKGKLPPFMVACGDRNRVQYMCDNLLDDGVLLNEVMKKAGKPSGRVAVCVGLYKGVPVAVFEHLMGTPSVEILVKEVSSPDFCVTDVPFVTPEKEFKATGEVVMVRVGSCGGVNSVKFEELAVVECGDIVIMDKVVGTTGCDIQNVTGSLDLLSVATIEKAREEFLKLGFVEEGSDKMIVRQSDEAVTKSLEGAAGRISSDMDFHSHTLAFTSKDSLYCESQEEEFIALRTNHQVACSEMEASCLVRLSAQREKSPVPLRTGAVCGVIGVIPGESFCSDKDVIKAAVKWACQVGLEGASAFAVEL
eukprot:TRINITY_DN807_c0_g1_i1.p1 TRINITY_DN807_c0_g1~~TRINITY_DN807_c0_g1_i1.p1  ORF type:complete len:342 (+),score=125.27 TRINITY_DN807_c0_g1_i1:1602-2627(+)